MNQQGTIHTWIRFEVYRRMLNIYAATRAVSKLIQQIYRIDLWSVIVLVQAISLRLPFEWIQRSALSSSPSTFASCHIAHVDTMAPRNYKFYSPEVVDNVFGFMAQDAKVVPVITIVKTIRHAFRREYISYKIRKLPTRQLLVHPKKREVCSSRRSTATEMEATFNVVALTRPNFTARCASRWIQTQSGARTISR